MNIQEFRSQFPQYNGFSDDTIARKLHAKHYADVDYDEFATRFGVTKALAQQIRPEAEAMSAAQKYTRELPAGPSYVPDFAPAEPSALPTQPPTSRQIYLGDLRKIYRAPGTTEQREAKATARTKARLNERVGEIQAIAQDPVTRQRLRENGENLKGKLLNKTYRRWERGEVMVVGGGLHLAEQVTRLATLGKYGDTTQGWARLMHRALQEPEMQPVIENAFDKYFGGAVETGPFLGAALGSAALSGGATLPSTIAGFLVAYGVEGNNIEQTALDQGKSLRDARIRGIVGGVINGGIEVIGGGPGKYLKKAALESTIKKLSKARYYSKRVLKTALAEGLREELPQEFISMVLGGDVPRKPDGSIDYYEIASRLVDAGVMGTILGGAVDAPFSAYAVTKLPSLPKGDIIDVGNGRFAVPGVVNTEANIISEESGNAVNPWIKQDTAKSNKGRTLAIQFIPDPITTTKGKMYKGKAYRNETGLMIKGKTVADVIRFEQEELGNDLGITSEKLIELENIPSDRVIWVARDKETAAEYVSEGEEPDVQDYTEIVKSGEILAEIPDGVLVLKKGEDALWVGEVNNTIPGTDVYVVKDMAEAKTFLARSGYDHIVFNAIDTNKEGIKELAKDFKGEVSIGGPTDLDFFADLDNTKTYKTIQAMVEGRGLEYKPGTDLSHFESTQPDLTETEIRTEIKTVDEAIGAQLGLTPTHVQDKLTKAEQRYRLLKNKDTGKRSKADKDELAFLSRNRGDIEALVNDYTSEKPLVRNLWKEPKKPSKKILFAKGHEIPEQLGMSDEERRDLQEEVTGFRTMADMARQKNGKDIMTKWVKYLEAELAARGEVYEPQPAVLPQLVERLETTAKKPVGKIVSYLRQSRIGGLWDDLKRMERWFAALDGYENGPLYQHIWKRVKQADELRNVMIGQAQTEFFRIIEDQNIDSTIWCGAKQKIRDGLELTPFEQIGIYLLDQNKIGHKYLTKGMAITDEDIALVTDKLTEEQLAVATWLDEQYRSQWPILRAAAIDAGVDPKLLEQELNYSPILRTDIEDEIDFVSLLTQQFNSGSLKPEQGFLEQRQKRAIGKLELDAGVIYMKNIQRIETFKTMAPIAKDLGKVFRNQEFKTAFNNATDGRGVRVLNTWLRDTIRGFMSGPQSEHAKMISMMRRNGIIYAIGFNIPSSMRQGLSLSNAIALDPLMLKHVSANMYEAAKGNYGNMEQFVEERSALVRTREYDRDLRKKWDATNLGKRLAGKKPWSEKATNWIRWVDKRTVTVAWKSLYDVALEKGMNDQTAIEFADQGITRTQPMANMKDLPHFFRGGTIERLLSTFQNQVNNNLNFYMHDIIGARIAGKISNTELAWRVMWSYVIPAIAFGIIGRGGLPTDEGKISLKKLLIDLTTYPAATLMLAGRLITRMIRGWGNSGTIGEIAPEEAIRTMQAARRGDIGGMIKHAAATYGAATGRIPAQAIRTAAGAMDLVAGTTKDPRRLIYTQWALDQDKEKVKKPTTARRAPTRRAPSRRTAGR